MSQKKSSGSAVFVMTRCGILAAMAVILYYIEIPVVAFYKLDLSTLPAILAGFAMGPLPGVAVVVIKNLVHMLGTSTACVGELADILVLSSFAVVSSLVFRKNPSQKSAALSMAAGAATITVVGSLANKFMLIPFFSKVMPLEAIIDACHAINPMIDSMDAYVLFGAAPFNLIKGIILSLLTLLLYKKMSGFIRSRMS